MPEFVPKLWSLLRQGIPAVQLRRDVQAGMVVGIVALPLAIAFGIASGVTPVQGLVTAIVAGFLISALGGSRVQIGGPTGAFIVIVYGIVQTHGVQGLVLATLMAGALLVLMGLLRFGHLLKYFPHTLVVGFTSGIALIILSSQVKELLGLEVGALPPDFLGQWVSYMDLFHTTDLSTVAVGIAAIAVTVLAPRVVPQVPGPLLAIVGCTAAVHWLALPVNTIGGQFGALPQHLPNPQLPTIDLDQMRALVQPALAIALLGGIESLLSAVVADGMIGARHRSNMELVAQGVANMASAFFGGIPATGAIARTATNVKNGGRTPVSGMVHAITLLAILLLAAPLAAHIPLAALAGILMVVAYHMSEWRSFLNALRGNRYDSAVLVVTFLLTVLVDLVVAIEVGMVLAAFLFMKRMSDITDLRAVLGKADEEEELFTAGSARGRATVRLFDISGPLFFGAAQKFQDVLAQINDRHRVVVLRMRDVPLIDATGLHRLQGIVQQLRAGGRTVYLLNVQPAVLDELQREPWMDASLLLDSLEALERTDR
jgi:SulP family sulfate permease